ncbi:MAG: DNA-processing protein DprA [Bifidobacteriaceae bacterium]|jgi:DNA processing protein|nr:DNA-processing protein DprA [Bifidobacteriaceae bacterium]
MELAFDLDDPRLARVAWSRIGEPGDRDAGHLVRAVGPEQALRWLVAQRPRQLDLWEQSGQRERPDSREQSEPRDQSEVWVQSGFGEESGPREQSGVSEQSGSRERSGPLEPASSAPAGPTPDPSAGLTMAAKPGGGGLERARARWLPRLEGLDPGRELRAIEALGGGLLLPDDPGWPVGLNDLEDAAPFCLWVRSEAGLLDALGGCLTRAVAVVGMRACTAYGETVTAQIAADLVAHGVTVVSGGAFGVDAAAHRAALAAGGLTVSVMAGGVDRFYPAGNERLLGAVAAQGAVISELPPGAAPRRERFLQRNRLIAAITAVTVVTESGWRSGAHRTARDAAGLMRPVAAVPGPVTAASSAGCHKLIREGVATLVTNADEVLELAGPLGLVGQPEPETDWGVLDGMTASDRQIFDALPRSRGATPTAVVLAGGLSTAETMACLSRLERDGRAVYDNGLWRRRTRVTVAAKSGSQSDA